jgi:hypothetical protein
LQNLVSALLVLTVVLQTLTLIAPMPVIAGQPAVLFSLVIALIAVFCTWPSASTSRHRPPLRLATT